MGAKIFHHLLQLFSVALCVKKVCEHNRVLVSVDPDQEYILGVDILTPSPDTVTSPSGNSDTPFWIQ